MKFLLRKLLILLVLFSLFSCNNQREQKKNPEEMYFEVNENLLGNEQRNQKLGVAYAPPLNWNKIEGEARENLSRTLEKMGATKDVELLDVFFEPSSRSLLFISDISALPDSAIAMAIASYKNYFSTGAPEENIMTDAFNYNDFHIRQFMIQNSSVINFKLWFLGGAQHRFQMDYMVPANIYAQKVKEIESSIGSVHKTK